MTLDRELLEKARGGDRDAQDRLLAGAEGRVLSYIRIRLGRRLREDADSLDLLQETYAAALGALPTFEPRGDDLAPWLCAIAENQIRGLADRQGAAKRTPPGDAVPVSRALEAAAQGTGPVTAAARRERRDRLEEALLRLDADDREVLLLRHFQALTIDEIAARLGRSPTSVRRQVGSATERLGRVLLQGPGEATRG